MRQQINLCQPGLLPQKERLPLLQAGGAVLATLGVVVAVGGWQAVELSQVEAAAKSSRAEVGVRQKQLAQIKSEAAARQVGSQVRVELQQMAGEVAAKEALVRLMADGRSLNRQGFAAHFADLAQTRIPGLWLTRIDFKQGGAAVELAGNALAADRVPQLLEGMAARPTLQGKQFSRLAMERTQEGDPVAFTVSGTVADQRIVAQPSRAIAARPRAVVGSLELPAPKVTPTAAARVPAGLPKVVQEALRSLAKGAEQ